MLLRGAKTSQRCLYLMYVFKYFPIIIACLDTRLLLLQTSKSVLIECLLLVSRGLGKPSSICDTFFFNEESIC